jgi:ribosomal protein S18 acetylase RimI-like enzyme
MSVNPDYRGRGIGPRLVRVVEEKAREMQFKRLAISTLKVMEPAIALYTKCGASFVTLETIDITPRLGPIDPETGTEWDEVQVYHMKIDLY